MTTVVTNLSINKLTLYQKNIQTILLKKRLWPQGGMQLKCEKLKCSNCQTLTTYSICIKDQKCNFCKETKEDNEKCIKQRICDTCCLQKERSQCITKTYFTQCKKITIQKSYLNY